MKFRKASTLREDISHRVLRTIVWNYYRNKTNEYRHIYLDISIRTERTLHFHVLYDNRCQKVWKFWYDWAWNIVDNMTRVYVQVNCARA
jgi:hypothetical protein